MQPIHKLNNVQKAKILHNLFPAEIPGFLECTKAIAKKTITDKGELAKNWDKQIITLDFWVDLAGHVLKKIERYGKGLHNSSSIFSDQLFDGYLAMFSSHCLLQYSKQEECSPKFAKAVDIFFLP